MKVKFIDIVWDTSDDENPGQDVDLPSECVLDVDDDIDLDLEGADILSDKYGWCVLSFNFEVV